MSEPIVFVPATNPVPLEVCGDGVREGSEQCDDGNTAPGDCCSASCQFEVAGSSCADANVCNGAETCDGAGTCFAGAPLTCDDGAFCNGEETCDARLGCQAGTPPVIDDGVACTVDRCDEVNDVVVNTPVDGAICRRATPFDFDGDDRSDLLVQGGWRKDLELWSMDDQGVADITALSGLGRYATVVGNGDYDGDGVADILWRDSRSNQVSLFFMDGGSVRESVIVEDSLSSFLEIVGSGDYDGDGISDVLIYNPYRNQLSVWTMDGSGGFESSELPADFRDGAEVIASGDFDGDGMADILWRHPDSGDVDIWGLTGDLSLGSFGEDDSRWAIIGAGDFDGDGRDDLLLRRSWSDLLAVRLSTRGVFDQIDYERNTARADRQVVAMGDYDGDGRTDLVVYNGYSDSVWVWYLNGYSVTRGQEIEGPGDYWDFASVDQRKPGSR
jgi:cysteine-rich repeat protein